ncbi:MAG: glycosyltransferase [Formosimonas sp.]
MNDSSTPRVSFLLLAYNQASYIRQACEAALNQEGEPIEIIFSDDASTDDTFAIMQEVAQAYTGPHHIVLNRNIVNLGLIPHVNHVVGLSTGDILIFAAGDDISLKHRTQATLQKFAQNPHLVLVHSSRQDIDEQGNLLGITPPPLQHSPMALNTLACQYGIIIGATAAYRRSVFDTFKEITYFNAYEDLVLAFRAALMNGLDGSSYEAEPFVWYRLTKQGISQAIFHSHTDEIVHRKTLLKSRLASLDVCQQRIADARRIGNDALVTLLEQEFERLYLDYTSFRNINTSSLRLS